MVELLGPLLVVQMEHRMVQLTQMAQRMDNSIESVPEMAMMMDGQLVGMILLEQALVAKIV